MGRNGEKCEIERSFVSIYHLRKGVRFYRFLLEINIEEEFPIEQKKYMRLYNTSFHDKGRAEGLIQGLEQGLEQGAELAKRENISRIIAKRFGDEVLSQHQAALDALSLPEVEAFFDAAIFFTDASDIETWFNNRQSS